MPAISRRNLLKAGAACILTPALLRAQEARDPYADAVRVDGEPPPAESGSFTVAVLPDTQNYSQRYPERFQAQTQWIVANQRARNIAFVLHLGDITNRNTPDQWENAVQAMRILDGTVPYSFVPGNHDYSDNGACKDRTTHLSKYFPVEKYRGTLTFGGTYDKEPERMENSYHLFTAGDRDFLVLALEFGPRRDVVRWANEVAAEHKQRLAILTTHAYMYFDDARYDWQKFGAKQRWNPHNYAVAKNTGDDVTDGEQLWQDLVSRHENFILTLNGHVLGDGLGRTHSATPGGRTVHQMLVNFQMRPGGGDGWLRLLEFRADGKTVQVHDYSPTLEQRNDSPDNHFTLELSPLRNA